MAAIAIQSLTLFCLLLTFPAAAQDASKVQLLQPGTFHGDEVEAKSGEQWLALYKQENNYILAPVTLKVAIVRDELLDRDHGGDTRTGKEVSVENAPPEQPKENLLALLRSPLLKAGKVNTAEISENNDFSKGMHNFAPRQEADICLGSKQYTLHLGMSGETCELTLGNGIKYQKIASTSQEMERSNTLTDMERFGCREDDVFPTLLWAGDLDGDDRLDLLLSPNYHYNVSTLTLFLSSQAPKDKLVVMAAKFTATGC